MRRTPPLNAVAVDLSQDDERGKAVAVYNGAFKLGFASGSDLPGYIAIATDYPTIFVIATLSCGLAFAPLATTGKHPRPAGP